jgi:hypothetical protein
MCTLYVTPELLEQTKSIIDREYRLAEVVEIVDMLEAAPRSSGSCMIISAKGIGLAVDWDNYQPPFLLRERLPLVADTLLGLVYVKLGNFEKAYELLAGDQNLLSDIDLLNRLQNGAPVSTDLLAADYSEFDEYRLLHNSAILMHYGDTGQAPDFDKLRYFYHEALLAAPNDEHKAFTAKHYATLLIDFDDLEGAENILIPAIQYALSEDAKMELKATLCAVWLKKLSVPYDQALLANLKDQLWAVLQYYEKSGRTLEVGLILLDAAQVAQICESWSESLGYVNRALAIFEQEEQPGLLANAFMRRGTTLYAWGKNGNPQFYKGAIESFQEALKVFTREDAPAVFAEIHHQLGVIYSEIPSEVKKKSIWAAVSSTSFKEALDFYTKEQYPYEYASICNNFGNAMTKYPDAIHSDNHEKALFYYAEALDIRTAAQYPTERAVTLLNYIEACWYIGDEHTDFNQARFEDMVQKAEEVKTLVSDPTMLADAENHLEKLAQLQKTNA